jgi:hypothetical protein
MRVSVCGPGLVVAGLVACATAPATAQDSSRARWATRATIPIWIESVGVPAEQLDMVRRAFRVWNDAADGAFRFAETSEFPSTGIRVRFVRSDPSFGEAMPYLDDRTGRIVRADVVVTTERPGDQTHKLMVIYLTALHEVGHALGLAHTDDFETIMYQFKRATDAKRYFVAYRRLIESTRDIGAEKATGLARADRAALRRLYPP